MPNIDNPRKLLLLREKVELSNKSLEYELKSLDDINSALKELEIPIKIEIVTMDFDNIKFNNMVNQYKANGRAMSSDLNFLTLYNVTISSNDGKCFGQLYSLIKEKIGPRIKDYTSRELDITKHTCSYIKLESVSNEVLDLILEAIYKFIYQTMNNKNRDS